MYAPDPRIIHSIIYFAANALSDVFGIAHRVNSLNVQNSFLRLNVVARKFIFPPASKAVVICQSSLSGVLSLNTTF